MARPLQFRRILALSGLGVAVALIVGTLFADWSAHQTRLLHEAVGWRITGSPCRAVSAQEFEGTVDPYAPSSYTGLKVNFDDLRLSWSSGKSSCRDILVEGSLMLDTFPVCQFAHPRRLKAVTAQGEQYFLTGDSPVTLSALNGKLQCVLNSTLFKG